MKAVEIAVIWQLDSDRIEAAEEVTFSEVGIRERADLRLLRENVEVTAPGTMVVAEEYGDWTDRKCGIDLLGIDEDANLVVIELKRTEDRGH